MKTFQVFVYGTLLPNERNHHIVESHLLKKESGKISGKLFNVGRYPALILDETESVIGEWFTVTDAGLKAMDLLEGYQENRQDNHYDRVWINDLEKELAGFVYVYKPEKIQQLEWIPSGSWKKHNQT